MVFILKNEIDRHTTKNHHRQQINLYFQRSILQNIKSFALMLIVDKANFRIISEVQYENFR